MTINEAIMEMQGKGAELSDRASVRFAREQIGEEEKVFAAAPVSIRSRHGNFPGVIVFTDKRLLAAGGLPGLRRAISLPLTELLSCRNRKSPLSCNVTARTRSDSFSAMLPPRAGKNFAPCISALERTIFRSYK